VVEAGGAVEVGGEKVGEVLGVHPAAADQLAQAERRDVVLDRRLRDRRLLAALARVDIRGEALDGRVRRLLELLG